MKQLWYASSCINSSTFVRAFIVEEDNIGFLSDMAPRLDAVLYLKLLHFRVDQYNLQQLVV